MAINNIKIKSHDIYLEKDNNNKGGNLQIGTSTTSPNKLGSLTVYGNVNMTSPAISMSGANAISMSGNESVNINTPSLNVTGNVAMRDGKLSMWPTSIDIIESSNGSFNIDTPTLSYNSSEERLVVTNLNIQGANIGVIPSESLCVTAIASINDGGITTKITDELNIGANINNAGIKLNGNLIQTNSSGEIIYNTYSQMSITESINLKTNTTNMNSTVTIDNNSIVLKTKNETTNKYANLSISSNSIKLTASDASFNVTTSNFTISPASLNITAPNVVVNTNKIDLIRNNTANPINIDDFINYTPSSLLGQYKYDSTHPLDLEKYNTWSGIQLTGSSAGYGFSTGQDYIIKEGNAEYYYMTLDNIALKTHLKSLIESTKRDQIVAILSVEGILRGSFTTKRQTTTKIVIRESNPNMIPFISLYFSKRDFDYFNSDITNMNEKLAYLTFTINGYVDEDYNDAKLSIDTYTELEVASHRDLLIKPASNSGTNISYFPHMEYSNEYLHSVVVPSTTVVVNAGEFVEVFPAQDGSYDTCVYLSNNGILPGASGNTLTVNLGKGNGYIYYYINPENKMDKKLYFYGNNNVTVFSFNSGDPSYNFKFRSGASTSAGEKYMIIKK